MDNKKEIQKVEPCRADWHELHISPMGAQLVCYDESSRRTKVRRVEEHAMFGATFIQVVEYVSNPGQLLPSLAEMSEGLWYSRHVVWEADFEFADDVEPARSVAVQLILRQARKYGLLDNLNVWSDQQFHRNLEDQHFYFLGEHDENY